MFNFTVWVIKWTFLTSAKAYQRIAERFADRSQQQRF